MISKNIKNAQPEEVASDSKEGEKLSKEVLVIAQEVKIIKALASNDLSQRTKQLKKLRRWLTLRADSSFPFSEEDFLRIWKGLYYTMWMSDKPLVQEELAETLGKLIECFRDVKVGVQFFGAFLKTMCREWFGIDQWRMDKFLMLLRRMLRYMFRSLKKDSWSLDGVKEFNSYVFDTILEKSTSGGITMHFMDVFFEELAKVSDGELTAKNVGQFVKPFVRFMARQHDFKILGHCRNRIFHHLLYQSELGREYTEKYNAWKEMGFPTESIDDLEKVDQTENAEDEEEGDKSTESEAKLLDPRAGNVDVYVPLLPLDGKYVVKEIEGLIYKEETSTRSRKILSDILEKYRIYQTGKFPLGIQTMPKPKLKLMQPLIKSKVAALDGLENEMYSTTRKLKQLNKRKRKRLLASLNFSEANEDTFEELIENSLPKVLQNVQNEVKAKKRNSLASMSWIEEEADSENVTNEKKLKISNSKKNDKKSIKKSAPNETTKEPPTTQSTELKPIKGETGQITPATSEWSEPLKEGEIEYFIPSKKIQIKTANENLNDLVPNPFANLNKINENSPKTPKNLLLGKKAKRLSHTAKPLKKPTSTLTPTKRVKIVLQRNTMQKPSEYIKQIRSSPNVPYDATKQPSKGLLKPNSIPSPINPFYKKKIGLKFLNETL